MVNTHVTNRIKYIFMSRYKVVLVSGYLLAIGFFTTSIVSAFSSLIQPVSPPQTISFKPETVSLWHAPVAMPLASAQDSGVWRDPFVEETPKAPVIQKTDVLDSSGLRVKAIILSLRSGAVLEDVRRGVVYFVSDGEAVNGFRVKSISKTGVRVEIDGREIEIKLAGGQ